MHKLHHGPDSIGSSRKPGPSDTSKFKVAPEQIADGKSGLPKIKISNAFRAVSHIIEESKQKPRWIPSVSESRIIGKLLIETNEAHLVLPSIKPGAAMAVFLGYYLSNPHVEFSALEKEFGKTKTTSAMVTVSRLLAKWCRDYWGREMKPRLWARTGYSLPPMNEEDLDRLVKESNIPSNWVPPVPASRAIAGILARAGETCNLESQMGTPIMKEMLAGYFLSNPPVPFDDFSKKFGRPNCQGAIVMISRRLGKWYKDYLKRQEAANDNSQD